MLMKFNAKTCRVQAAVRFQDSNPEPEIVEQEARIQALSYDVTLPSPIQRELS